MTAIQLGVTIEDIHTIYIELVDLVDFIDPTYLNNFCGLKNFCIHLKRSVNIKPFYVLLSICMYKCVCACECVCIMNNATKGITKQKSMQTFLCILLEKIFRKYKVYIVLVAFFIAKMYYFINIGVGNSSF